MAENKAVSLALTNSECFQTSKMHDARINGVIHEHDNGLTKIWAENGKYFDTGHEIAPKVMNGFYNHKAAISGIDAKSATTLRSSPTRSKATTVAALEKKVKDVSDEDRPHKVPKTEGNIYCKWMDCDFVAMEISQLADHAKEEHIDPMKCCDIFVCLWQDCKVFNKPSCSMTWLTKHLESHIGIKPFRCVIDGCPLSFSSQLALARHVPCHFEENIKQLKKQNNNGKEESPGKRNLKRKRLKYIRYKKVGAKTEDFVDQHAVDSIKSRLSDMIVSDSTNRVGIDGATIHFKSQALGKRINPSGHAEVLLHWIPESILPDEWIPSNEAKKHLRRSIPICSLPNHVKADLHPSFYRRLSHRKERRK